MDTSNFGLDPNDSRVAPLETPALVYSIVFCLHENGFEPQFDAEFYERQIALMDVDFLRDPLCWESAYRSKDGLNHFDMQAIFGVDRFFSIDARLGASLSLDAPPPFVRVTLKVRIDGIDADEKEKYERDIETLDDWERFRVDVFTGLMERARAYQDERVRACAPPSPVYETDTEDA